PCLRVSVVNKRLRYFVAATLRSIGLEAAGRRFIKEGFSINREDPIQVLNSQGRAIPGRRHTHNAAKDFRELTLVGEAATYSSLKNSDAGIVKKLPGVLNPSPQDILVRGEMN